jgi:succinoglycan biosynthesis transport protein ExoP
MARLKSEIPPPPRFAGDTAPPKPASLGTAVRRHWPVFLLVAVATVAGGYWYAERLPSTYTAQTVVALSPRPQSGYVAPAAVTLAASKYVALIQGPKTVDAVAQRVGEDDGAVQRAIAADVETNTGNITISITWADPTTAADLANAFGRELVSASSTDKVVVGESVSDAIPPSNPSGPPRRAMEGASVVVAVALGLGLAFVLEWVRPKVETRSDLDRLAGPVLAEVPPSRKLARAPRTAFSEADVGTPARHLRTNVEARLQSNPSVICVTSPARGDGKSSIAAMVAEAFARKGQRTLLVDGDVHASRTVDRLGVRQGAPISRIVRNDPPIDAAVAPGWVENLSVLAPEREPGKGDVIATAFGRLVDQARASYPITIVDLPPLIGVDDARAAATLTDGVVLVVPAGTSPGVVHDAMLALDMVDAPYLGVVANRWKVSSRSYYYS